MSVFNATSAFALLGVLSVGIFAYVAANTLLPKNASKTERFTFIWLVGVDRVIHPLCKLTFRSRPLTQ
jgi:uncharacterized membrane protein HdeD (DUF308 family)